MLYWDTFDDIQIEEFELYAYTHFTFTDEELQEIEELMKGVDTNVR